MPVIIIFQDMIAAKILLYRTNINSRTGISQARKIQHRQRGKMQNNHKRPGLYLHRLSKRPLPRLAVQPDDAAAVRVELARQVRLVRQHVVVARQEVGAHLPHRKGKTTITRQASKTPPKTPEPHHSPTARDPAAHAHLEGVVVARDFGLRLLHRVHGPPQKP